MNDNEIKFCEYFENRILPNRNNVSFDDIRNAANLIGYSITGSCNTCFHNYAIDLMNIYGGLEPRYIEYKSTKNEWVPIHLRKKKQ